MKTVGDKATLDYAFAFRRSLSDIVDYGKAENLSDTVAIRAHARFYFPLEECEEQQLADRPRRSVTDGSRISR